MCDLPAGKDHCRRGMLSPMEPEVSSPVTSGPGVSSFERTHVPSLRTWLLPNKCRTPGSAGHGSILETNSALSMCCYQWLNDRVNGGSTSTCTPDRIFLQDNPVLWAHQAFSSPCYKKTTGVFSHRLYLKELILRIFKFDHWFLPLKTKLNAQLNSALEPTCSKVSSSFAGHQSWTGPTSCGWRHIQQLPWWQVLGNHTSLYPTPSPANQWCIVERNSLFWNKSRSSYIPYY